MHHQAKRTRGLGSQHLRSDFSLFSLLQSSSQSIRLEWLQRSCDGQGVVRERQSRVCSSWLYARQRLTELPQHWAKCPWTQPGNLAACKFGWWPPTYATTHAHHRHALISCPPSGSQNHLGTALRLHITCSRQSSLFTSLRPGSVSTGGSAVSVLGDASCMQDQGLISPRSNRRRPRGATSRASGHLSSDFIQAGKV